MISARQLIEQAIDEAETPIRPAGMREVGTKEFDRVWKEHEDEIKDIARTVQHIYRNIPGSSEEERKAEILRKMIDAVQYWNPAKSPDFRGYAEYIAKTAMKRMFNTHTKPEAHAATTAVHLDRPVAGDDDDKRSVYDVITRGEDPSSEVERNEFMEIMDKISSEMSPREQTYINGLLNGESLEEIGNKLGITRAGVSKMSIAIKQKLAQKLRSYGYDKDDISGLFSMTEIGLGGFSPASYDAGDDEESEYDKSTRRQFSLKDSMDEKLADMALAARYLIEYLR